MHSESKLRAALISFLDSERDKFSPLCSRIAADVMVNRRLMQVNPEGCPVTLREWIDARVGGEIETGEDDSGQAYADFRGKLRMSDIVSY